ncbi:serine beta-lactamase-like protein LACTB, mitochondrial [Trichonephila clavipes]|nr:serine beta-lactamase-like protein LACTB, mitochondrial [Trichonephila clavipes]
MDEYGIPGLVIGVSIDGKTIWKEGFGFADVENRVLCTPDTVMRIASISKSITMAAVAKLWEQGKLDLDKPIQEYVPSFPLKSFNGKPVTITCRQLVSHLGGIRHYTEEKNESKKTDSKTNNSDKVNEMDLKEYYLTVKYNDILTALDLFKDDPLVENPGTKFLYSTHGWTLISAIVEAVAKELFTVHITKLFKALGLNNTYLDENDVLIYNRSSTFGHMHSVSSYPVLKCPNSQIIFLPPNTTSSTHHLPLDQVLIIIFKLNYIQQEFQHILDTVEKVNLTSGIV